MEDFGFTIGYTLVIAFLAIVMGASFGVSMDEQNNRQEICKHLCTKTTNYEQCEKTTLENIYKLIKPIDEVK